MSLEDLSFEARDELAALAKQLAENPATRKDFLRMTKQVKPEMPIPELDIEDYTRKEVGKSNERVEHLEAKLRERDALDKLKERRQSLLRDGLVANEEEIDEVEKVMLEKNIADHKTAAEYFAWMKQSAVPTPTGYNPSAMSKFNLNDYWKNPVQGARNEAAKALNDLRKPRKPIGL